MKFPNSLVEDVISASVSNGFLIQATISFTSDRVLIIRGTMHPEEVDFFRQRYLQETAGLKSAWQEDCQLATEIGATLVIGQPVQLEKFKRRLQDALDSASKSDNV